MGYVGGKYTWSNKHESGTFTKECLDRTVANKEWTQLYYVRGVEGLVATYADHKPFLLTCKQRNYLVERHRQKLFRYETSWNVEDECARQVENIWKSNNSGDNIQEEICHLFSVYGLGLQSWSSAKKNTMIRETSNRLKALQDIKTQLFSKK